MKFYILDLNTSANIFGDERPTIIQAFEDESRHLAYSKNPLRFNNPEQAKLWFRANVEKMLGHDIFFWVDETTVQVGEKHDENEWEQTFTLVTEEDVDAAYEDIQEASNNRRELLANDPPNPDWSERAWREQVYS